MEILQGRLVRGVQRFFGIQGDAAVPQLSPDVQSTLEVGQLPEELQYLFDVRRSYCFFDVTGDATHPAQVQLYNPTSSGVLAVLEGFECITVTSGATVILVRDMNASTLITEATTTARDGDVRWFSSVPASQVRTAALINAVGGSILAYTNESQWYDFPYILTPSTFITLQSQGNAQRLTGHFRWRERRLPDLEQRLS